MSESEAELEPLMFDFEEMEDAEAFADELEEQFGKESQVYDIPDDVPFVCVDRTLPKNDAEVAAIKQRFGLTDAEITESQKEFAHWGADATRCAVGYLAEAKIEQLAKEFGGEFVPL